MTHELIINVNLHYQPTFKGVWYAAVNFALLPL
jgi:hypothetical protein